MLRSLLITTLVLSRCMSVGGAEPQVATVDLNRILKADKTLTGEMAAVTADVEAFDRLIKSRVQEMGELAEKCKQAPQQSEERALLITEIKEKQASAKKDAADAKAQFLDREAQLYLAAYKRWQQIIADCAKQKGILLVVRSSTATPPANPMTPDDVQRLINSPMVYVSGEPIDITDEVIRHMDDTVAEASTPHSCAHLAVARADSGSND